MPQPPVIARGRAARSNNASRFSRLKISAFDDGWSDGSPAPQQVPVHVTMETARSIISRNKSPDLGFEQSINPYRGCEHGCIYCFARPTHAYLDLSPGLDFETKLFAKANAAELLARELSAPLYRVRRIQLGANTDPYQPIEKNLGITREVIDVLSTFNHPFSITTKSNMVTRDIDLLAPMARNGLVTVAISITTLDHRLARAMEPRAATPQRRLDAMGALSAAGIPTCVGVSPMIPGLTDHEMDAILTRAAQSGASHAYYSALRLPLEISTLFQEWLAAERPNRAARVMSLVRQMHGGRDYDATFGIRGKGLGPIAQIMHQRFEHACRRAGLTPGAAPLNTGLFRAPPRAGDQLDLF